jgi:hypothetical protein
MSENNQAMGGYGYEDDDVPQGGGLRFGLNQGTARLAKFEWIPNGGKDGAEQEALDIEFTIEGREKPFKYRKFPVNEAFKDGVKTTDPKEVAEARKDLNAVVMHILGCFVSKESLKEAFNRPITSFKEFCKIGEGLLPANFKEVSLDIFAQYQWQISGENERTYLELPKNMKQGKFLAPATTIDWQEVRTSKSLKYVDPANPENVHPFLRGEYFMGSNWAKQQKVGGESSHEAGAVGGSSGW